MKLFALLMRFHRHIGGNIAIPFAVTLLPMLVVMGAAVDYSEGYRIRAKAANATDAALLAATNAVLGKNAPNQDPARVLPLLRENFDNFFHANMKKSRRYAYKGYDLQYDIVSGKVSAKVRYGYKTTMLGLIGKDQLAIDVEAQATIKSEKGGAISVFLVLDKSGSMRLSGKMSALKRAVNELTVRFNAIDPKHQYIRVGGAAYHARLAWAKRLAWGGDAVNRQTQKTSASGGTNSFPALKHATEQLLHKREVELHKKKTGQAPKKIMVFMTDGANNSWWSDHQSILTCNRAKRGGVEVFSIGFRVTSRAIRVLKGCASSPAHFSNARNSNELLNLFRQVGTRVENNLVLSR